ncbi:MAG TPA: hypothetical protein PKA98_19405 [Acidimicrobiales bacterium]|nr:hypothetical protein [Acidimicrobiales bacterium]
MLDAEALSRLAHGRRAQQAELIAAFKSMTDGVEVDVVTSSAVLAELLDGKRDAGVWSALRRYRVDRREVDDGVATRAGHLLTAAGMDSANAVDAFVAATAALQAPALVVTGDPGDLRALTADLPEVAVEAI